MSVGMTIVIAVIVALVGWLIGYLMRKHIAEKAIGSAEIKAQSILLDAEHKSQNLVKEKMLEAQEKALEIKNEAEEDAKERRKEISKAEKRNVQREEMLDRKLDNLERKEQSLTDKEKAADRKRQEIDRLHQEEMKKLEEISGYTQDEAKDELLKNIENEIRVEASSIIKDHEAQIREECDKTAKEIIVSAIQRCAADQVAESTVSVVNLPNDEMKGRIIGREGRNIRALETATGVELIIDDTPEAVILSGYDPVRREVARIALEKLIVDGRIHPARIEEMVAKAEKEVQNVMKEAGEQVTFDVGIHNLHPELVKLLGRLKFRTSYGQNALVHSQEVAILAGLMAQELGLDGKLAKRAGLLHDIGKALDHDREGTHIEIGIELLKKYKEKKEVVEAMRSHHGDYEPTSLEAILIAAADALSAARPGARRETLEAYINRLESLEEIANKIPGVEKSYAIQAGREIRIIAKPDEVSDSELPFLARSISKNIEDNMNYPGQIKVNIVRETRAVDYAK